MSEISFKTDPQSTDYVVEAGATRNFMAFKLAEEQAVREMEAEKEDERLNPMKVFNSIHSKIRWPKSNSLSLQLLENRTKASRGEIETVEALEELKELNKRKVVVNYDSLLERYEPVPVVNEVEDQEVEDEQFIKYNKNIHYFSK